VTDTYHTIVLGSGIAGSITALVLQQLGCKTLVVERKTHPRFVIGESTLPTTSLLLHHLASAYGVPEIAEVAHYLTLRDNHCAAWPKQHFWYGVHREGAPLDPRHENLFETLLLPAGPDVHMLRADADAFLASRLEKYGVDYLENTELIDFRAEPDGITVRIKGPAGERDVRARFLVDATGHASFLASRFGLRDKDAQLHTNTRSIFAHFKGVPDLDEALGGCNPTFRYRRNAGTMHHCFPGGWWWVIPFDNGVTSVGLQMDRRMYPLDESITPEAELAAMLDRYPSMKRHLGGMEPIRPLIRTDRIQFTCKSVLGDGFILTPHAGSFIEPLFSTGILLTLAFVSRFAAAAKEALADGDWNIERFRFVERLFFAEVHHIDHLVNGMIQSFRHYEIFKQYWRNWVIGTFSQWCTGVLAGGATRDNPMLYGSGLPGYMDELRSMHEVVCQKDADPLAVAAQIHERTQARWEHVCSSVLRTRGDFSIGSDRSLCVHGAGEQEILADRLRRFSVELRQVESTIDHANAEAFFQRVAATGADQLARYERSRHEGTDYHLAFERILANQNPDTFDYAQNIGLGRT
jgi:FADH2 O2-dependent halogenase